MSNRLLFLVLPPVLLQLQQQLRLSPGSSADLSVLTDLFVLGIECVLVGLGQACTVDLVSPGFDAGFDFVYATCCGFFGAKGKGMLCRVHE
jgi:hypothetical protein